MTTVRATVRAGIVVVVVVIASCASSCVSGRSLCCFGPPPCFGYDNCSIPGAAPTLAPNDDEASALSVSPPSASPALPVARVHAQQY